MILYLSHWYWLLNAAKDLSSHVKKKTTLWSKLPADRGLIAPKGYHYNNVIYWQCIETVRPTCKILSHNVLNLLVFNSSHHQVPLNVSRILQTGGLTCFFSENRRLWFEVSGIEMETEATILVFTTYFNLFQIAAWEPLLYTSTLQLGVIYPIGLVIYMIAWYYLIRTNYQ